MKKRFRIGLLIDSYFVYSLVFDIIEQINKSEHSEVILIIKNNTKKKKKLLIRQLWENRNSLLYNCYLAIERRVFKTHIDLFYKRDLRKVVDCPTLSISPQEIGSNDVISQEDVDKIKSKNVDVLIKLGFSSLKGDILKCCKYGIWGYHHGDSNIIRGGPKGAWEVLERWKETAVIIQILGENVDEAVNIGKAFLTPHKYSIIISKSWYYYKLKFLLLQKLKELHFFGEDEFFKRIKKQNAPFYSNRFRSTPTTFKLLKLVTRNIYQFLKLRIKFSFHVGQWFLLFITPPIKHLKIHLA